MPEGLTAIFDLGKTNKKFFLFDEALREVHQEYVYLPETKDENEHPCEDLHSLREWLRKTLQQAFKQHRIQALNVSTYGASLVHLDQAGQSVGPLYNYTKTFPKKLKNQFFKKYGPRKKWSLETASPSLGMLNAGLQLYWIKNHRPQLFARIRRSLHLPQYCTYLFSGEMRSDYTSIGCHTGLWNYEEGAYHYWVKQEGLDRLLAPIHFTYENAAHELWGQKVKVGSGIHDSSAALLPYLRSSEKPFLLLSTGTWSIALNPFNHAHLTEEELNEDCLNYMVPEGWPVRASRLFLGQEHKLQLEKLNAFFQKDPHHYYQLGFNPQLLPEGGTACFQFTELKGGAEKPGNLSRFPSFEAAYHCLMQELVALQVRAIHLALGKSELNRIFIDGGFSSNDIFISLLQRAFPDFEFLVSEKPLGSAIGAALALRPQKQFNPSHYDT